EAAEFRAQGAQRGQEIRSRADRDVTVLVAEAQSKAEQIRGEGDAKRNQIFAEAYTKDPDFFSFYRSLQAYEAGLKPKDTRFRSSRIRTSSAISAIPPARAAPRPHRLRRRRRRRRPHRPAETGPRTGPWGIFWR